MVHESLIFWSSSIPCFHSQTQKQSKKNGGLCLLPCKCFSWWGKKRQCMGCFLTSGLSAQRLLILLGTLERREGRARIHLVFPPVCQQPNSSEITQCKIRSHMHSRNMRISVCVLYLNVSCDGSDMKCLSNAPV